MALALLISTTMLPEVPETKEMAPSRKFVLSNWALIISPRIHGRPPAGTLTVQLGSAAANMVATDGPLEGLPAPSTATV